MKWQKKFVALKTVTALCRWHLQGKVVEYQINKHFEIKQNKARACKVSEEILSFSLVDWQFSFPLRRTDSIQETGKPTFHSLLINILHRKM